LYNRQSENINNPSLLYLAVSIERDLFFKRIMKIDELPEDVRKKVLNYQKQQVINTKGTKVFDYSSNNLDDAFDWEKTDEGCDYWNKWYCNKQLFTETMTNPYVKNNYDSNGVTQPKQYQIGIDTFQRSESNLTKQEIIAICKFNIDKYCWRKKDQDKEDFKKIIDYANWAIKNL
jgi:hypothetical protein